MVQVVCVNDTRVDGYKYMYLRVGKTYDVRWETETCFVLHTNRGDTYYPKSKFRVVGPRVSNYIPEQNGDRDDDI